MPSFNRVILAGHLTRDIDLRYTPSGTAIAGFSLAVNRKWKSKDGAPGEEVSYIDVTAFGRQAETLAQYVRKGSPLLLEGRLKQDRWETPEGQRRSKLIVVLEGFQFLTKGDGTKGGASGGGGPAADQDVPF